MGGAAMPSRRVVIIDSNYDEVRTTAHVLAEMGHKVDFAITGCAGLDIVLSFLVPTSFLWTWIFPTRTALQWHGEYVSGQDPNLYAYSQSLSRCSRKIGTVV
jgi:hypothetical protein